MDGMDRSAIRNVFRALLRPVAVVAVLAGCGGGSSDRDSAADGRPVFVATIAPLGAILVELAGDRARVATLLPPGASPHSHEPSPGDARTAERATALFQVAPSIDGWAARLSAREKIAVFDLLPTERTLPVEFECSHDHAHDHDHAHEHANDARQATDGHFWTDPSAVAALAGPLAETLAGLDPEDAAGYRERARGFRERLEALDREIAERLAPARGKSVALFHASMNYLLHRHGIRLAGVIERSPGAEPSPREAVRLAETLRASGAGAVFVEPQFPARPAEVVAEAAGVPLGRLDPLGAADGPGAYERTVRANVEALAAALR